MFALGHLGIGSRLVRPLMPEARPTSPLPAVYRYLLLGCVLPDLIDKPLYYAFVVATGRHAEELGLISGTRTIGHTLLYAILCYMLVGGQRGLALFLGMCTHALLDLGGDLYGRLITLVQFVPPLPQHPGPPTIAAVLFPLLGAHFPIMPYHSLAEHVSALRSSYVILGELIGGVLLLLDFRAYRRSQRDIAKR